ncbi:MAG: DUF4926 domain-containing protein [SAR324 cluster bacterium]|nr:DUF4926 domain-containing protein [SAR324 cluster bacterium]
MMNELDTVVLLKDINEHGLTQGDIGAVVHCYNNHKAFEVEFVTAGGETVALLTLTDQEIRAMRPKEILHVRVLDAA